MALFMFLREPRIMLLREARIHLQVGSNCAVLACLREYVIVASHGQGSRVFAVLYREKTVMLKTFISEIKL